jgi:DNA invertase Pin-like site-specific DNA recombinase
MGSGEKVIGYTRVSTDSQGANGSSLEAQRLAIEQECKRRCWELVRIEEDILSGRNMKRPGLQRALDACRSGEVAGVVVAKLDRLSRSLIDFAGLLEQARCEGWNIVGLDLGVDLSTPSGELLASVMASVAQWERRVISERTKTALAVVKAKGEKTIGRKPSIPPKTAKRISGMRRRGMTLQAICDTLNAEGVPTARGGALWRPTSLRAVLRAA